MNEAKIRLKKKIETEQRKLLKQIQEYKSDITFLEHKYKVNNDFLESIK